MPRRDDVIAAAVDILRTEGSGALTSVHVAARVGISQPAVYRHIKDMDELTTIASGVVVDELIGVVLEAAAASDDDWGEGTRIAEFARRIARLVIEQGHGFEIMDRCRYDTGELGEGIRSVLAAAGVLVAEVLEYEWRRDLAYDEPFDDATAAAQILHGRLIADDIVTFAHMAVSSSPPYPPSAVERMLTLRVYSGWGAYSVDMARRCGIPVPEFDGACLKLPVLVEA
jgi:AcrR family transcriptional regulator